MLSFQTVKLQWPKPFAQRIGGLNADALLSYVVNNDGVSGQQSDLLGVDEDVFEFHKPQIHRVCKTVIQSYAIISGMRSMERPATLDLALAQKADRKLRRYGSDLNRVLSVIVAVRGVPDFVVSEEEPKPLDPHDPRIDAIVGKASVRRGKDGLYHAESPEVDCYYSDGKTRSEALAEMREDLRFLISDPVKVKFFAYGKPYVAEARPAREGGFWATVPALDGAATQGDTMDELKYMLIDMAKLCIEEK